MSECESAKQCEEPGQIELELRGLEDDVSRLESCLGQLQSKINPICRECLPSSRAEGCDSDQIVEVAATIRSQKERVQRMADCVDDMMDRIEL